MTLPVMMYLWRCPSCLHVLKPRQVMRADTKCKNHEQKAESHPVPQDVLYLYTNLIEDNRVLFVLLFGVAAQTVNV